MTIYTERTGASQHPEDSVLQHITDFLVTSGVLGDSLTDFEVTENSPTGLSILIDIGRAYLKKLVSNAYPVRSNAVETLAITNNGSGNTRKDAVVLYIDLAATANVDASNIAKLVMVDGTPAVTPVPPTDGDIATAIGSSNPFIRLANVTVVSGATQIFNADIADTRVNAVFRNAGTTDGWLEVNDTWAYASATTITVPTDATTKYDIGDKIKLTQTTVKYFIIVGVSATLLTITGGSDYTLTNNPISDISYSKIANPHGFPQWFTWPISYTYDGTPPSGINKNVSKFNVVGRLVFFRTRAFYTVAGVNNQNIYYQLPITPIGTASDYNIPINSAASTSLVFPTDPSRAMTYGTSTDTVYIKTSAAITLNCLYTSGFYEI